MKIIKKVSMDGTWVKVGEDIKDQQIITILDEGKNLEGQFGTQQVFKIHNGKGEFIMNLNQTSQNNLFDAFGEESKNWIGKEVKAWVIRAMVSNKMRNIVYLAEKTWEMSEGGDGSIVFLPPLSDGGDEISVEDVNNELNN
jgi:hypothetical protein